MRRNEHIAKVLKKALERDLISQEVANTLTPSPNHENVPVDHEVSIAAERKLCRCCGEFLLGWETPIGVCTSCIQASNTERVTIGAQPSYGSSHLRIEDGPTPDEDA